MCLSGVLRDDVVQSSHLFDFECVAMQKKKKKGILQNNLHFLGC